MRTLAFLAICAFPLASFFIFASRCLDQAQQKPQPAAIMFTAGTAKQLLKKEQGMCVPPVLRDTERRVRSDNH